MKKNNKLIDALIILAIEIKKTGKVINRYYNVQHINSVINKLKKLKN